MAIERNTEPGWAACSYQTSFSFFPSFNFSVMLQSTGLFLRSNFMKLNKSSEPGFHCLYVYAILLNHLYGLYLLCPRSFFSSIKISWRYFSKLPNFKICPAYQPPPKVEEREESEGERKILFRLA